MTKPLEYRFVIDAYTPETIPMLRLAEYMTNLAKLLGHTDKVHFVRIEPGSATLVQRIESDVIAPVQTRVRSLRRDGAPREVVKAHATLQQLLTEDKSTGSLQESTGEEIIRFPEKKHDPVASIGPIHQTGELDGVLIRIGGRRQTASVHLQRGHLLHICSTSRAMVKRLAPHLYGPTLRVRGDGTWERSADGAWKVKQFHIINFEVLNDAPLTDVVKQLRAVKGSRWKDFEDPWAELRRLRGNDGSN